MRFGFNLGFAGSQALAAIIYQTSLGDFVYSTDVSGNVILDNQGSLGSANDGLPYSGRGIELGALNDTTIGDAAKWTTWFSFTDNVHHKVFGVKVFVSETINSVLVSASEPSTDTMAAFDANPNLVGKLALSGTGTISEVDLTLVATDSYYMCSEKSGAYLVDSRVAYGADVVVNGTFDTDTVWTKGTGWTISSGSATSTTTIAYLLQSGIFDGLSSKYKISIRASSPTLGSMRIVVGVSGTGTDKTIVLTDIATDYSFIGTCDGGTTLYIQNSTGAVINVDNVSAVKATSTEIANYAETVRTNADLQQKGIQLRAFTRDGVGVPIAHTPKILNYYGDDVDDKDDTQWNPSLESAFWLEEVISGVVYQHKYDGVNLTTYTNNVIGTPSAHSPENASYLLGKGVYPKVTADPYTSYQAKTFQLHTGNLYANYDQTSRYAILAAL